MFGCGMGHDQRGDGAQAAAGAVARDGVADFLAGGQAIMDGGGGLARGADLQDESGRNPSFAARGYGKELRAFA